MQLVVLGADSEVREQVGGWALITGGRVGIGNRWEGWGHWEHVGEGALGTGGRRGALGTGGRGGALESRVAPWGSVRESMCQGLR